jgi:hypothetical protein
MFGMQIDERGDSILSKEAQAQQEIICRSDEEKE